MILLESAPEIAVGIAVETLMLAIVTGVIYRTLSGKFLIPKREVILPNQLGVIVQGERVVRVAEPGTCWIKPKQRVVLVDARPRPLQLVGLEVLGSDNGILRVSLSADYKIADAAVYYASSANAGDALFVQIRRILTTVARCEPSVVIMSATERFTSDVNAELAAESAKLGLQITRLQIWDFMPMGFLHHAAPESEDLEIPQSHLIQ